MRGTKSSQQKQDNLAKVAPKRHSARVTSDKGPSKAPEKVSLKDRRGLKEKPEEKVSTQQKLQNLQKQKEQQQDITVEERRAARMHSMRRLDNFNFQDNVVYERSDEESEDSLPRRRRNFNRSASP